MPGDPQGKITPRLSEAIAGQLGDVAARQAPTPSGAGPGSRSGPRADAETGSDQPLEVVVELQPVPIPTAGTRQERMAAMQRTFERDLAAVSRQIEAAGGDVLGGAWLNRTVRGRLPADQVGRLAEEEAVVRIDLPSTLEPDWQPPSPSSSAGSTSSPSASPPSSSSSASSSPSSSDDARPRPDVDRG